MNLLPNQFIYLSNPDFFLYRTLYSNKNRWLIQMLQDGGVYSGLKKDFKYVSLEQRKIQV